MSSGEPLTDQDRLPWLQAIHKYVKRLSDNDQSCVVTCSALKKVYRDILRYGDPLLHLSAPKTSVTVNDKQTYEETPGGSNENLTKTSSHLLLDNQGKLDSEVSIHFIHLTGSREVLQSRLVNRLGHFMPAALLQSQLDTLENLDDQETGFTVDVNKPVEDITEEIVNRLDL